MTYEVGLNSFSGPSCVKRCYEDKTKAGLFTEDKYKEDVHPKVGFLSKGCLGCKD